MDDPGLLERICRKQIAEQANQLPARLRNPHFSNDSERLPRHRYGVDEFFPIECGFFQNASWSCIQPG
jgi:hypothetical protein